MTKARDLANASTALSAVSATELAFVDGVTSAIQTQMDAKATLTGTETLTNKTLTSPVLTTPTISTVNAKGDLLAGTADNTVDRLAVGNDGEQIVADSSTSTGLRYQGSIAAGKNVVINGALDIWQRGTSFSSLGRGYKADRWECTQGTNTTTWTTTRQSPSLSGFQYCLRNARTSGATDTQNLTIGYSVETADSMRLMGKTVTMSFYARAGANYSASGNIFNAYLQTYSGTDSSIISGFTSTVVSVAAVLTTSWQRFSITGTTNSAHQQIGALMWATPTGTAGANDYYEITGLQIEEGSVATQFSRAGGTIQGELAACQRYLPAITAFTADFAQGQCISTTKALVTIPWQVQPRVAPTGVTVSAAASFYVRNSAASFVNLTALTFNNASVISGSLEATVASGLVAGNATILYNSSGTLLFTGCEL